MTDPNHDLNRILHALNSAEPPTGMEARIAHHLAQAPTRKRENWFWWLAGTAVATALLALIFVAGAHHPAAPRPQASNSPIAPPLSWNGTALVVPSAATNQASSPSPSSLWKGMASAVPSDIRESAGFSRWGHNSSTPPNQLQATPSRGLADLPSQLAPPAPITAQERRLAQLACAPDRETLALLNPVERELIAQQREADFTSFFPPPTNQVVYLQRELLAQQRAANFIPPPTDQEIYFAEHSKQ